MKIQLTPVESSQITAIGHDAETNTLAIQFKPGYRTPDKPGAIYHYANFTAEDFARFMAAESKGKHFGGFIKCFPVKYPYVRQPDAHLYGDHFRTSVSKAVQEFATAPVAAVGRVEEQKPVTPETPQ